MPCVALACLTLRVRAWCTAWACLVTEGCVPSNTGVPGAQCGHASGALLAL